MPKKDKLTKMKVAIVCDWLTGIGGAERVVLELHRMFPSAPIYTSQYDPKKIDWFKDADVHTGWLQKLPNSLKKFLPVLRAWYFSHLDLSGYDLVISSSGAEAKAVKTGDTLHICYMHAPTHYYWSRYEDYLKNPGFPTGLNWLAKLGLRLLVGPLRRWDYKAAQKPSHIIANSSHTSKMIAQYYNRDSVVIFPPVDLKRFVNISKLVAPNNLLIVGRQTPYKKIDLAVSAATKLNIPLSVLGDGPEHNKLTQIAGPTITFIKNPSDEVVTSYMQNASALIFPGLDDFGITPVEAMAAGKPVIAYKSGGALDYIVAGVNGDFFKSQTVDALCSVLQSHIANNYSSDDIKKSVQKFSVESFHKNLQTYVYSVLQ